MTTANEPILLVGAGPMAEAYARVLAALDQPFVVFGRGGESAAAFAAATSVRPTTGSLSSQLEAAPSIPSTAIVAVNAMFLADVTAQLARAGVQRLLVEKPAALDNAELESLLAATDATGAEVFVAYNRRFLSSVRAARAMADEDGGVLSVKCDFSEPSRRIATLSKPQRELDTWFYGNSSHVVDLALHFTGTCEHIAGSVTGGVSWHPDGGVFAGHGRAESGALLSWHANWMGPGRWGLEVVTAERRLILQPLEQLRVQTHSSFDEVPVDLDDSLDREFKPGLWRQARAFLVHDESEHLCTLSEHTAQRPTFEAIRSGSPRPDEKVT